MPVFEQGYRKYVGERTWRNPAFAIAWQNVRPRLRWWTWVILFLLLFFPYVVYAGLIFAVTVGAALTGGVPPVPLPATTVAFEGHGGGPSLILGMIQGGSLSMFWDLLHAATFASVVVPAALGSGLLASDRRTGALQIYFARPVSRRDYMLGKVMAATLFVAMTTAIPCLLLWGETVAFASASTFTWKTWIAPLAILGSSTFYALWAVALVLSLSSVMRRPAVVAIAAIMFQLALEGMGNILAHTLQGRGGKGWHVIAPSYAIGTVTAPLCGLAIPDWINAPVAFGVAVGVPVALLSFVWWRLRAVEVAT